MAGTIFANMLCFYEAHGLSAEVGLHRYKSCRLTNMMSIPRSVQS